MSDTPRTDAKIVLCNYGEYRVPAEFARELERENAKLRELLSMVEEATVLIRKYHEKNKELEEENARLIANLERVTQLATDHFTRGVTQS